jgi:hypothetical protein
VPNILAASAALRAGGSIFCALCLVWQHQNSNAKSMNMKDSKILILSPSEKRKK